MFQAKYKEFAVHNEEHLKLDIIGFKLILFENSNNNNKNTPLLLSFALYKIRLKNKQQAVRTFSLTIVFIRLRSKTVVPLLFACWISLPRLSVSSTERSFENKRNLKIQIIHTVKKAID